MFVRLLKLPPEVRERYDVSSLRLVSHAAAPCPVEVKRQMIEWLGPDRVGVLRRLRERRLHDDRARRVARPPRLGRAAADDAPSTSATTTTTSCRSARSATSGSTRPAPAFEYHGDPEKTKKSRSPEGWFNLGDVGYLDDEGYLYLTDRQSFTIISGGVNIYPQETEDVLVMHPAVADVAVFGVPNDDLGEEVKAVVQLDRPGAGRARRWRPSCSRSAASTSPRSSARASIDFDADLPRQDTGKLYKRLLKDRYWGDRTSRIV